MSTTVTTSTSLTEEEIKKLGFRPPTPPAKPDTTATTTKIVGFFNPNPWAVKITSSTLGLSDLLQNKGEYIKRGGKNINDPALMQFVGPQMLSVEVGETEIPINRVQIAASPVSSTPHGFSGNVDAKVPAPPVAPASVPVPPTGRMSPVRGMTIAEARKKGIIGRELQIPEEIGVLENDGAPVQQSIPELKVPKYPRGKAIPAELLQADTPERQAVVDTIAAPAPVNPAVQSVIGVDEDLEIPIPSVPPVSTSQSLEPIDLPQPVLDDLPVPVAPKTKSKAARPFTDAVSGKSFKYRSELVRYLSGHHKPEEVDQIMSAYPEKGRHVR